VPHVAQTADHLYVFQRTPSSIDVRGNRKTDPDWAAALEPGWQKRRMDNFNTLVSGGYQEEDLVADGWTDIIRKLLFATTLEAEDMTADGLMRVMELADFEKMEQIRGRVDSIIEDDATADALKPWYRQFCKRPCFHDDYLPSFNRSNVTLVDTQARGVERIVPEGVVVDGQLFEVDCIIFATGFEVGTGFTRQAGYEIYGRDGLSLKDKWEEGIATYHGMHVHDFPNLFVMSFLQGGFTANFPHMLNEVSINIAYVVQQALERGATTVEATAEAEAAWVQTIIDLAIMRRDFFEQCTPGYYNNEGQLSRVAAQNGPYGLGPVAFFKVLEDWREAGALAGLELTS